MEVASGLTFKQALNFHNDGLYTINILYWVFGKFDFPQLLPAFGLSVILFSMSYITCDMAEEREAWQHIKIVLLYQFMVLPIMLVAETFRSGMSLSLIVLMVYLELVKGKKAPWIWFVYLACIFIHNFAILFVALRILVELPRNVLKLMVVLPFITGPIIIAAYGYIDSFYDNPFLHAIVYKTYNYFYNPTTGYALGTMNNMYFWRLKVVMGAEAILMIIIAYYYSSKESKEKDNCKKFLIFFAMICLVSLAIISAANPLFWRFEAIGFCCCAAIILPMHDKKSNKPKPIIYSYLILWLLALPALYLNLRWSITYAESNVAWIEDTFVSNIFTVAYHVFCNIL